MARGTIRVNKDRPRPYEALVDLGADPATGRRRQRSKSFRTKREAQAYLTQWQASVDNGTAVDRSTQTVGEMMRYWLDTSQPNLRPSTYELYRRVVEGHIIPAIGAVQAQKLTADRLEKLYADMIVAGRGPRTVQMCHVYVKQALKQALRLGLVSRNVAENAAPPRSQAREMQVWDAAQQRRFLAAATASRYGPIWLVALATGLRRGELLGLRWQDADLARGVLSVRQTVGVVRGLPAIGQPKTASGRRDVAIPPEVTAALREHRARQNARRMALGPLWEDNGLVFAAAAGQPIHPDNLKGDYDRLVAAAGVPRIRIHDLRHSHVTLALASGAPLKAVSARVGHASTAITLGTYAHVLPEQHQEVAARVGAALFGPLTAPQEGDGAPAVRQA